MSERIIRFKTCPACKRDFQCPKKIGLKNWVKRRFCSRTCSGVSMPKGESANAWKEEVGYAGLHKWIARVKGRPNVCTTCGTTSDRRYEWASISRKYKRDEKDWMMLCVPCHRAYDQNWANRTRDLLGRFI